jgi:hypothetical protein
VERVDIDIRAGDTATIQVRVIDAAELRIEETAPEAVESLTIDAPVGETTIRFRTAIPPQLVDGIT